MSFLKITDPAKRDFIVEEFLKYKKKIKQNYLSDKLGDIGLQHDLSKLYKPILDSQSSGYWGGSRNYNRKPGYQ